MNSIFLQNDLTFTGSSDQTNYPNALFAFDNIKARADILRVQDIVINGILLSFFIDTNISTGTSPGEQDLSGDDQWTQIFLLQGTTNYNTAASSNAILANCYGKVAPNGNDKILFYKSMNGLNAWNDNSLILLPGLAIVDKQDGLILGCLTYGDTQLSANAHYTLIIYYE